MLLLSFITHKKTTKIVNNGMKPLVNKTPITALGARDL